MILEIGDEYELRTLPDLLAQVQEDARAAWYRKIELEVWLSYCDLAKADVQAGRSTPQDHPMFPPGVFVRTPFDLISKATEKALARRWQRRWQHLMMDELAHKPAIFDQDRKP